MKESDLLNIDVSGGEGYAPDGVIKLSTDFATDANVETSLKTFKTKNKSYNGLRCNCADFAEAGIESALGKQLGVDEDVSGHKITTPNQLFKATQKLKNSTVLKDPGSKVDQDFLRAVAGSDKRVGKAQKKLQGMHETDDDEDDF